MTSCTASRALPLALCATLTGLVACGGPETVEIAIVARDPGLPCVDLGQQPLPADMFALELHQLSIPLDQVRDPEAFCRDCATGGLGCRLVESVCRCGGPAVVDSSSLDAALSGVRFSDLEAGATYCVRVVAIHTGTHEGPFEDCSCPRPGDVADPGACGVSVPFDPAEATNVVAAPKCAGPGPLFSECMMGPQ